MRSLVRLAILKRTDSQDSPVSIRLGKQTIYAPDYALLSFFIKEKFVGQEYFFQTDNSSPVIIDCGASIGISALYFKALYPGAIIHCVEPYSKAFQFLKLNVAANNLENVFIYNMAVSDKAGPVNIYVPESGAMINARISTEGQPGTEIVNAVRLSQMLSEIATVDLIKLDVEGAEYPIMQELVESNILSQGRIKRFIIEYHYSASKGPEQVNAFIELLKAGNYRVSAMKLRPKDPASDLLLNAWQDDSVI